MHKESIITLRNKSGKHSRGKVQLQNKSQREQDIVMALQKYDKEVHPVGETLPTEKRVYKIKVVSTFLKAGVQITKIDRFRPLLYRRSRFPSCRKETDVKLNSIHTWRREEPYPTRDWWIGCFCDIWWYLSSWWSSRTCLEVCWQWLICLAASGAHATASKKLKWWGNSPWTHHYSIHGARDYTNAASSIDARPSFLQQCCNAYV